MAAVYIKQGSTLSPAAANKIAISPDGNNWDYIDKTDLKITGTFMPTTGLPYRYPQKTLLHLSSTSVPELTIELQDVVNQSGWNLGTQAAINTATSTIASW